MTDQLFFALGMSGDLNNQRRVDLTPELRRLCIQTRQDSTVYNEQSISTSNRLCTCESVSIRTLTPMSSVEDFGNLSFVEMMEPCHLKQDLINQNNRYPLDSEPGRPIPDGFGILNQNRNPPE